MKAQSAWTVVGTLTLANAVRCHKNPRKVCCCTHQHLLLPILLLLNRWSFTMVCLLLSQAVCISMLVALRLLALGCRMPRTSSRVYRAPSLWADCLAWINPLPTWCRRSWSSSCRYRLLSTLASFHVPPVSGQYTQAMRPAQTVCAIFPTFVARLKATPLSFDCCICKTTL